MKKMERETDYMIRSYLEGKKLNLPISYRNMVKTQVEFYCGEYSEKGWSEEKKLHFIRLNKAAAVLIVICASAAAAGGAYAAINYVQQRMQNLSEKEKETFTKQAAYANADSFSRELSVEEKSRLKILIDRYQSEGLFPEDEVYQITDTDEIISDRVCFLPETSTFYFPDEQMSDEQLLELIDFCFKREYSLTMQDITTEYQQVPEISEEEAVQLAGQKLENVYGIDAKSLNVKVEYNQSLDGEHNTFTTDYITFTPEGSSEYYFAAVNLQNGHIDMVNYGDKNVSDYSDSVKEDEETFRELYDTARNKAVSYLGAANTLTGGRMEYLISDNQILNTGIVNYVFKTSENDYCIVSYSCARKCFYQIRSFTSEEQSAVEQSNADIAQKRNLEYVIIDMGNN